MTRYLPWICSALLCAACDGGGAEEASHRYRAPPAGELPYDALSEYGFFEAPLGESVPVEGVVPYVVAAPLWADHSGKDRYFALPEGAQIDVEGEQAWRFPVGSIVIKHFFYSGDRRDPEATATLVETRLLIREADEGWTGHTYVWNEAQTDAVRKVAGDRFPIRFIDASGAAAEQTYVLPNTNQCKTCHELDDQLGLLGPVTRQLARPVERGGEVVDQLQWLAQRGLFDAAPSTEAPLIDPFGDGPLPHRARSYLEANCGHCHQSGGHGGPSGLMLLASEARPSAYGICKSPVAAGPGSGGRLHDIVPGRPDRSIMVFRMASTDPDLKMPEIPNLIPDQPGIDLVSEWIAAMEPAGCNGEED